MKKLLLHSSSAALAALLLCLSFSACASSGFEAAEGKVWLLTAIEGNLPEAAFTREDIPEGNNTRENAWFSLSFDAGKVSGIGAPNRFNGPFATDGSKISQSGPFASTMMLALNAPETLSESTFFKLLQDASSWELGENQLIILSGKDKLIFQ
ncbi:MAG: META domain-containing protein [Spirochaetaceae bacterium]|jgi:heat shock protein HslJ|nr:META domain-containing protein [Spirochaetaceae bacterium]